MTCLRHRLFAIPATIARQGHRMVLHLSYRSRWAGTIHNAISTPRTLPAPSG